MYNARILIVVDLKVTNNAPRLAIVMPKGLIGIYNYRNNICRAKFASLLPSHIGHRELYQVSFMKRFSA